MASEAGAENANQVKIIGKWVTKPCQALKRKKNLTSRLQAAKLCAANEILKEDISLIKAHKGHP